MVLVTCWEFLRLPWVLLVACHEDFPIMMKSVIEISTMYLQQKTSLIFP